MKSTIPATALALALCTTAAAAPTAVERNAVVVEGGLHFQKQITLNQAYLGDGSVRLEKGTYDVTFDSLQGNKVRATFFQGGQRKGEAQGIIIIGGRAPGAPAHKFGNVAFGPEYGFQQGAGKMDLVVGSQGTNQILIGLLVPAVQKVREAAAQPAAPAVKH